MGLPVPVVGSEAGPNYALDVNSCMTIIDQHNHSPGSGVQITPAGLNINASLSFGGNFGIAIGGLTLTAQSVTPAINTVYESGTDLFFVDGLGNNVRITQAGAVAGTPGSIANLVPPATATYVAGSSTFVWQSNASIAANMDFGVAIMRNLSPNSTFALTLQPPAALSSNYSITLPTLPGSTSLLSIDSSGNIAAAFSVSGGLNGSAITPGTITATQIANSTITSTQIATNTIATANYADGSVTNVKRAPCNFATSSQSPSTISFTGTLTVIPGLSVSITTTGHPVYIQCQNGVFNTSGGNALVQIFRDGSAISGGGANIAGNTTQPGPIISFFDQPSAGTHTYDIRAQNGSSSPAATAANNQLVVREVT